jgi:hypothetical protein
MDSEWALTLQAALKTGNWTAAITYLKSQPLRPPMRLTVEDMKERFKAGACVGCGRDPCDHCESRGPLFCEVCWNTIERNKPPGMVISGLARVVQQITYNQTRQAGPGTPRH